LPSGLPGGVTTSSKHNNVLLFVTLLYIFPFLISLILPEGSSQLHILSTDDKYNTLSVKNKPNKQKTTKNNNKQQ
jgi:hypothetical protein